SATATALTSTWTATSPTADSYTFQVSTASDFSGTLTSSNTVLLTATTTATLSVNTTYYGRVVAVINGSSGSYSSTITTATLANIPVMTGSTWTTVVITSLTVNWQQNGNPSAVTRYDVEISTSNAFNGANDQTVTTYNLNNTFTGLVPA